MMLARFSGALAEVGFWSKSVMITEPTSTKEATNEISLAAKGESTANQGSVWFVKFLDRKSVV